VSLAKPPNTRPLAFTTRMVGQNSVISIVTPASSTSCRGNTCSILGMDFSPSFQLANKSSMRGRRLGRHKASTCAGLNGLGAVSVAAGAAWLRGGVSA
jgi:hypothetical protein